MFTDLGVRTLAPGDNSVSCVGPPTINNIIRLADWEDGNYMNSDKDLAALFEWTSLLLERGPCGSRSSWVKLLWTNLEDGRPANV